jgi:hypothetical protein
MFHRREIEGADKARDLYVKLGRPSQQRFEYLLANHLINNCPVTADDARRALLIYGPDHATLKGENDETRRTTRTDCHPHLSPPICTGTPQGCDPLRRLCLRTRHTFPTHNLEKDTIPHRYTRSKPTKAYHAKRNQENYTAVRATRIRCKIHTRRPHLQTLEAENR